MKRAGMNRDTRFSPGLTVLMPLSLGCMIMGCAENRAILAILAIPVQTGMQMESENLQECAVSET